VISRPGCAHEADEEWNPAPDALRLDTGDVHVWRVPLELPQALLGWAHSVLDDVERARAARFRFGRDRVRFVAGRALQREILARYLRVEPDAVRYRTTSFGKLQIAGPATAMNLQFNFSNSAGLGLLAIAAGRLVGVDIEQCRPVPDTMQLAADWFSAADCAALDAATPARREVIFLSCWTRAEAYMKAVGRGLSLPADDCHAGCAPRDTALLLDDRSRRSAALRWKTKTLAPAQEYVGALAAEGDDWTHQQFEWVAEHLDGSRPVSGIARGPIGAPRP
jgi:4'-phosphopantetheinyl transferase